MRCHFCGHKMDDDATVCGLCNKPIPTPEELESKSAENGNPVFTLENWKKKKSDKRNREMNEKEDEYKRKAEIRKQKMKEDHIASGLLVDDDYPSGRSDLIDDEVENEEQIEVINASDDDKLKELIQILTKDKKKELLSKKNK